MTEELWVSATKRAARAGRLVKCGFDCIKSTASPDAEELRYAEYEFQLYSMYANWLAEKSAEGEVRRAVSQQVCIQLKELTTGLRLGEAWSDQWEACLELWFKSPEDPYLCPVLIDRVDKPESNYPKEAEPAPECNRENVWAITRDDRGSFFYARDFSGMFAIADDDPAYRRTASYVPPEGITEEKWLFERRLFMQIQAYGSKEGVAVQPWRACEFLPDLMGPDAARIRGDDQWRRLYRVIRALSDVECNGFFDRLQGYDNVNLSVPLFHYTLTSKGNKALAAELGGLLIWLERFDPALALRFAHAGLSAFKADSQQKDAEIGYVERHWADDEGWGARYEVGSGAGCNAGARVIGSVSIGAGVVDSAADMQFLRRPHFHYRAAMLLRTLPDLRIALWKLAIHRVRNLAWQPLDGVVKKLPSALRDRSVLGQVLTSELAMAIAVRLHIFQPSAMLETHVVRAIVRAWAAAEAANPTMSATELQQDFEYRFCQDFFTGSIEQENGQWTDSIAGSNLHDLPAWPSAVDDGFGTRLRQTHLEGNGQADPSHPQPPRLSWAAWSSPFWKTLAEGRVEFLDPVAPLDRNLEFKEDGHPAVPMRYPALGTKQNFSSLGTQVLLPTAFGKVAAKVLTAQRVRESLAALGASHVLIAGRPAPHANGLDRRLHGDGTQFWARRCIGDMRRAEMASALRCGTQATAPALNEALWALDGAPAGSTVYAFDWRNGLPAGGEGGEAFATVGNDAMIASQGDRLAISDRANFGAFVLPLEQKTFRAFELAFGKGIGMSHVDQFRIEPAPRGWLLTLAGVRQYFPVRDAASAPPSEWGLMIEYMAWRYANRSPDQDGWYGGPFNVLRNLGFDVWVPQPATASATFLRQSWPAAARGLTTTGPLDGLSLRCAPHLWYAPQPLQASSNAQIAAAMLNWPALYRLRRMFQDSDQARRAVYDLWRMGIRAALTLPLLALKPVFAKQLPLGHQLFQGAESLAMLACWRYLDSAGLAQALRDDKGPLAKAAKTWFGANPVRKDFRAWTSADEYEFVWQALVPAIQDPKVRAALETFRPPLPVPPRVYVDQLDEVVDMQGLDSVAPSIPQIDYQAVLLRQPTAQVGLGLLTSPTPPAPAMASELAAVNADVLAMDAQLPPLALAAADQFWVGGIVPVLKVGAAFKAVPLMLPEPALVRLSQGPSETVQIGTLWARDGAEELLDFSALDIAEPFTIEAEVSSWLGEFAQGLSLTLLATVGVPTEGTFALSLGLRLTSPWLHKPLEWSRQVVDISGIALEDVAGGKELVWRFPLAELGDTVALPIQLDANAGIVLALGLKNGAVTARFSVSASTLTVGLGSPVASLRLQAEGAPLGFEADLLTGSALVTYPDRFCAYLALELAALPAALGDAARIVPTDGRNDAGHRVPPFDILLAQFGAPAVAAAPMAELLGIDLSDLTRPRIPVWLFESGVAAHHTKPSCRLLDIAGQWLEGAADAVGAQLSADKPPVLVRQGDQLQLALPVLITVASMQAEATLNASCALDTQGYLQLRGDSFACRLSAIKLTMEVGPTPLDFGSVAKLTLPSKVEALLTLDGSDPGSCFCLVIPKEGDHPVLAVPASGGIKFDVGEFALGSGGLTLAAKVSRDVVTLDLPVLDKELAVQEPKGGMGEFRIVRGRLVSASLQAKVRLKVFDDAEGVLTMRIVQDSGGLTIMAELDVGLAKTFHLRALYLQVIVASINLSLSYGLDGRWNAKGGLTGSMKFCPEGPMLGRLEEYRSLFDGTSVHFENMDLARLGESPITVMVTPRTFDVGSMFAVTWRGFVLQRPGDLQAFMGLRLLGDITLKQRLPKMRVALTLGDITIRQLRADSLIPKIAISSIGVDICMSGGFSFKGRITEFDDAYEYGFGGEVELRSEAIPATQALIKLTRLKADPAVPSIAVYASMERDDSLGYGFFLRKVGIGVGIRQGLRGFSDEPGQPSALTIAARVERTLRDPRGLPYPAHLSSWQALLPGQRPEYVLVAYMLVTFGLFKPDVDHPLAASAVLAIDDNLDIIVGLNGWFVTSPDNTGNDEYIAHPAIKGALALSPREQVLYGRFMTLPKSKFGETANLNPMMRMLQSALDAVRLSVSMYADPRGALIEVGWPRNARFEMQLGPARGWAEAGFRFGYYRGTQVVGLNLAVQAEVSGGFSQDMGFANVSLSVLARFQLQATFAGAVTSAGQYYVLAEVMLSALLEISAHAYKRIHISGWGFSFTVTLFDVSVTLGISATAVLQTAIVPSGLGFNGSVEVHIRVAGFGIGARVRIGSSEGRIDEARSAINALVPPIADLIQAGTPSVAPAAQPLVLAEKPDELQTAASAPMLSATVSPLPVPVQVSPAIPKRWRCYALHVADELRVVLFPDAEGGGIPIGYPPQAAPTEGTQLFVPRTHTLWLNPEAADAFKGVVGHDASPPPPSTGAPFELTLVEAANDVVLPHDWLKRLQPDAPRSVHAGDLLANVAVEVAEIAKEIVDPRTVQPVPGDFDDPAVLADPTRRSTRFRKRYGSDDVQTYDDHLRLAMQTELGGEAAVAGETSSGELLMQLMNMARDASVRPGQTVAVPAQGDRSYSPHLLVSRLGLVLSFQWSAALEAELAARGVAAIIDPGKPQPVMFNQPTDAADWSCDDSRRARFQIEPGYYFQGKGEVGLVWSVVRTNAQGEITREGPANHSGIAAFRVQRLKDDLSGLPASGAVRVIPSWPKYKRDGTTYYIRPPFQFLDHTLPVNGTAVPVYLVEALADDGKGDTVLASQIIPVHYRAPSSPFSLVHAQAMLRLPPEAANSAVAALAPYRLEFLLHVDVDTRGMPERDWQGTPAELARLGNRIELYRHRLDAGVLGRYGQGHDGQVSVSWSVEDKASGIALPETDQLRQLSITDLDFKADLIAPLEWTVERANGPATPGAANKTIALTCRARLDIRVASERADWDRVLGAGGNAAELHVRLKLDVGGATLPPELATSLLRCRIALTRDTTVVTTATQPNAEMTEGTEVAALERLPLAAAVERQPEWLPPATSSFRAEVAAKPFVAGGRPEDIGLRLRGIINHARDRADRYGAVIGYRVWALDRFDADPDRRGSALADFLVEPEALYRAMPTSVTVRQLAGGAPGQANWRFDGNPLRLPATSEPVLATTPLGFGVRPLYGGNKAALHASLIALASALDGGPYQACFHADEPMWPAISSSAGRLAELLARHVAASDAYGWRLLEALGGSATMWLASDDDRFGLEAWEGILAMHADAVAAITFSRLQPGERPDNQPLALYGVRVFSRSMLEELLAISVARDSVAQCLALPGSQLAAALRLIAPPSLTDREIPRLWVTYVETLLERQGGFVITSDPDHPPEPLAAMWELAKVPAAQQAGQQGEEAHAAEEQGVKAQFPLVLPTLGGQVHVFHTLENGYARSLEVAVEVVRRYDIVAPRAARILPAEFAHEVPVVRTQALEADRWAITPDPETGALTALVAVHSAQRLVLYRSDLAARVQFIEQKVRLQRAVAAPASAGWDALMRALAENFDRDAYEASWVVGEERSVPKLSQWSLDSGTSSGVMHRGYDEYHYADLPPFYAHGVQVITQAGVRHSAESSTHEMLPVMAEAMFTRRAGLSYPAPQLRWVLADDGATLLWEFALVRGVDALRERARAHWIARDQLWPLQLSGEEVDLEVPVLQLPDLRAHYSLVVTGRAAEGLPLRVELVQLAHRNDQVDARVLIGSDNGMPRARATLVQISEEENRGRIGIACSLSLTAVELAWLRTALTLDSGDWSLSMEVQRDGVQYRLEGETP